MQATYEDRNVAARINEVRKAHPDIYLNLIDLTLVPLIHTFHIAFRFVL